MKLLLFFGSICLSSVAETNGSAPLIVAARHVQPNFSKLDANQNGRIDADEAAAYQRAKIRERQEKLEAERKAALEARKLDEAARRTRMVSPNQLKQYDTNTNGLIDLDEWQIYRADVARRTAEKRAARLAAAANSAAPSTVISTNAPARP